MCWPTQPRWAGAAASAVCGRRPPGNTLVAPSLLPSTVHHSCTDIGLNACMMAACLPLRPSLCCRTPRWASPRLTCCRRKPSAHATHPTGPPSTPHPRCALAVGLASRVVKVLVPFTVALKPIARVCTSEHSLCCPARLLVILSGGGDEGRGRRQGACSSKWYQQRRQPTAGRHQVRPLCRQWRGGEPGKWANDIALPLRSLLHLHRLVPQWIIPCAITTTTPLHSHPPPGTGQQPGGAGADV